MSTYSYDVKIYICILYSTYFLYRQVLVHPSSKRSQGMNETEGLGAIGVSIPQALGGWELKGGRWVVVPHGKTACYPPPQTPHTRVPRLFFSHLATSSFIWPLLPACSQAASEARGHNNAVGSFFLRGVRVEVGGGDSGVAVHVTSTLPGALARNFGMMEFFSPLSK